MKIFKRTLYSNKNSVIYVNEDGIPYTDNLELQTEYRIPKIKARRRYSDVPASSPFSGYIWKYLAERVFSGGKWKKFNYYMMTSRMSDFSPVTVGTVAHFQFSISRELIA